MEYQTENEIETITGFRGITPNTNNCNSMDKLVYRTGYWDYET